MGNKERISKKKGAEARRPMPQRILSLSKFIELEIKTSNTGKLSRSLARDDENPEHIFAQMRVIYIPYSLAATSTQIYPSVFRSHQPLKQPSSSRPLVSSPEVLPRNKRPTDTVQNLPAHAIPRGQFIAGILRRLQNGFTVLGQAPVLQHQV